MIRIDSGIALDFPEAWQHFEDGNRYIFHTSDREEIIVSATTLGGDGRRAEREQLLERIFANGLETARRGASHSNLRITKPLGEEIDISPIRCVTVLAETAARDAFFGQAIIRHSRGVVFLTYEAPFVDGATQKFGELVRMIHESEGSSK